MRTRGAAGSVTATFTGTAVSVVATKGPAYGKLGVTLDGVAQPAADLYHASTNLYQQKVFTKSGLANGGHTLKLAWTNTKNDVRHGDHREPRRARRDRHPDPGAAADGALRGEQHAARLQSRLDECAERELFGRHDAHARRRGPRARLLQGHRRQRRRHQRAPTASSR